MFNHTHIKPPSTTPAPAPKKSTLVISLLDIARRMNAERASKRPTTEPDSAPCRRACSDKKVNSSRQKSVLASGNFLNSISKMIESGIPGPIDAALVNKRINTHTRNPEKESSLENRWAARNKSKTEDTANGEGNTPGGPDYQATACILKHSFHLPRHNPDETTRLPKPPEWRDSNRRNQSPMLPRSPEIIRHLLRLLAAARNEDRGPSAAAGIPGQLASSAPRSLPQTSPRPIG